MHGPTVPFSQELHAEKYRAPGESFEDACRRISRALSDDAQHGEALLQGLLDMSILPAGRVQSAVGSDREVTPYNCFVSGTISDSFVHGTNSIMDIAKEAATTLRLGGGIGYDFSTLRPSGAEIKKLKSQSTGPVSFMEVFNAICLCVASSGHRRGAQMAVLRVDHPDILEFIRAKQNHSRLLGFNVSVAVTDEFMDAVLEDKQFELKFGGVVYNTVYARELWRQIMLSTYDWAEPGVLFIDAINRANNLRYCETIAATNPCFSGDEKVMTDQGPVSFRRLVSEFGGTANVLTETEEGKIVYRRMKNIRRTQSNAVVVEVHLDDGSVIRCTPCHKFFMTDGSSKEAEKLQPGDSLETVYKYAANQKGYVRLQLSNGKDAPLEHHVPFREEHGDRLGKDLHVHHKNGVKDDNRPENLEVLEASEHNASHMRGDLNPLRRFPERNPSLGASFDGEDNPRWRKDISTEILLEMREAGLSYSAISKKVGCSKYMVMDRVKTSNHKVVKVVFHNDREDVFCGSVEETGRFFLSCKSGGVLVSNCAEQPLPPYGACLLGSVNIAKMVEKDGEKYYINTRKLRSSVTTLVRALDNVIDTALYPLEAQREEAVGKRRMGVGPTGMANAIEALGYPYGSEEYIKTQNTVMEVIRDAAYWASIDNAKKKGSFELFDRDAYLSSKFVNTLPVEIRNAIKEHGIRNSHLLSVAPTGTISLCADNVSSGIEPVFSKQFTRIINMSSGVRTEVVSDYGCRTFGVEPRTAGQVSVNEHVDVLCAAQRYVDSSVSKTCNVRSDISLEEFCDVYLRAWLGGAKGCTTYRIGGMREGVLQTTVSEASNSDAGYTCSIDPVTGIKSCAG